MYMPTTLHRTSVFNSSKGLDAELTTFRLRLRLKVEGYNLPQLGPTVSLSHVHCLNYLAMLSSPGEGPTGWRFNFLDSINHTWLLAYLPSLSQS